MARPIDAVVAIHNAFRADIAGIDAAALAAARGNSGLTAKVERFRFFNEVLAWHAHGEELAIFPALEEVVPLVGEALETARATAAFKFHLDLQREDAAYLPIGSSSVNRPPDGGVVFPVPDRDL